MDAPDLGGKSIDGSYWSLNVELKFYLLIAAAYYFLKDKFWIAMALLAPIGYLASLFSYTVGDRLLLAPYMPFFLIGIATWYALFAKRPIPAMWTAAAGIACLPFASFPLFIFEGQLSVLAICITLALIASLVGLIASHVSLPLGPLPYLGRISYSLYLLHENIGVTAIALLKRHFHFPDLLSAAVAAALCLALAAAVFHLVEIPAQHWLRRRYHVLRPHLLAGRGLSRPKTTESAATGASLRTQ